jgi:hypothetical protein
MKAWRSVRLIAAAPLARRVAVGRRRDALARRLLPRVDGVGDEVLEGHQLADAAGEQLPLGPLAVLAAVPHEPRRRVEALKRRGDVGRGLGHRDQGALDRDGQLAHASAQRLEQLRPLAARVEEEEERTPVALGDQLVEHGEPLRVGRERLDEALGDGTPARHGAVGVALADEVGVGLRLAELERADAGRQRLPRHAEARRLRVAHVPTRYAATLM